MQLSQVEERTVIAKSSGDYFFKLNDEYIVPVLLELDSESLNVIATGDPEVLDPTEEVTIVLTSKGEAFPK